MTSRAKTTDEEYEKLMSGSGKKQTTLSKEKSVLANFKKYLTEDSVELEDIKDDTEALSKYVGKYLNNIRVPKSKEDMNTLVRPKLGYFNVSYSHLKTALRDEINKDLNNKTDFKKLHKVVKGIRATIKSEGRDTTHTPRLPEEVLNAIYSLLSVVQAVMQARITGNRAQYEIEVKKLPTKYRYIIFSSVFL